MSSSKPQRKPRQGLRQKSSRALVERVERLRRSGLKITRQREALLRAAIRIDRPFTAEELHQKTEPASGVDLVTVYRCLAKFVEIGLLSTCDLAPLGDHAVRYELTALDGSHHHHIICTSCKRMEPVSSCVIKGQEKILNRLGYRGVTHKLEFFGTCPDCAPRES